MNIVEGNIVLSVFPEMPTLGALGVFTRPEKAIENPDLAWMNVIVEVVCFTDYLLDHPEELAVKVETMEKGMADHQRKWEDYLRKTDRFPPA